MSNNHVSVLALPKRLKLALALLALHAAAYAWLIVDTARSGEQIHPWWVIYVVLCLFVFPEVRNARLAAFVVLLGFCFFVPSCMIATEYGAKNYDEDRFIGTIMLVVPVYLGGMLVLSAQKFYRQRQEPQSAGSAGAP